MTVISTKYAKGLSTVPPGSPLRPAPVPSRPTPPCGPALPPVALPRPAREMSRSNWYQPVIVFPIPGHAWDEKDLQKQSSVGLVVSIQEQIAAAVPLINRL